MENQETFEERQYQRLIDARNFHYENFNKWSMYFYAIIAALFVGYYGVATAEHKPNNVDAIILGILILGYIVSICCYLSGKGYYYWEVSWIRLLHNYEKNVLQETADKEELRIYSRFCDIKKSSFPETIWKGANISSSKLSLWMSFIIACSWMFLLLLRLDDNTIYPEKLNPWAAIIISVAITWCITYVLALMPCIKSNMSVLDEASKK